MSLLTPLQVNGRRRLVSSTITLPPPIEGWVSQNDPRSQNMTTARILENMIPRRAYVESRMGRQNVCRTGGNSVETLMSFEDGAVSTLLSAADGNIYECPLVPAEPGSIPPQATQIRSGFSNNRWQFCLMADGSDTMRMPMVNGQDGLWYYEEIAGTKDVIKVNTTPEVLDLLDVTNFKGRLWFTQDGTSTLWYGDPLSNKPDNLTPFYVGPLLRKGGSCLAIDSVSLDGGSGPDDYLVVITTEGEAIAFSGIDPATDFQMIGLWSLSKPVSVRCFTKLGRDLFYFGSQGPEALSKLMGGMGKVDVLGNAIQDQFENATKINRGTHGWQILHYSKDSWIICNIPIIANQRYEQYCMNLETGGWFKITNWDAACFTQHDGELYYGKWNGRVAICNYTMKDNEQAIPIDWMQNWNEFGTPNLKKFNNCKLTLRSISKPRPKINMMTDYVEANPSGTTEFPREAIESPWDVSPWDVSPWSSSPIWSVDIFGLTNQGYVGALRYQENVKDSYTQIYGVQVMFEVGDIL